MDGGQKIQPSLLRRDRPTRFKIDSTDNDVASERERAKSKECFLQLDRRGMPIIRPFYLPEKCSPSHSESLFTLFHYAEFCAGNEGEARPEGGAATPLSGFRVPPLLVGRAIKSQTLLLLLLQLVQNYNIT